MDAKVFAELKALHEKAKPGDASWEELSDKLHANLPALLAAAEEAERMRQELEPLVAACEEEFTGPNVADEPDDSAVGASDDGDMKITFGMIRRARAAISPAPAKAGGGA